MPAVLESILDLSKLNDTYQTESVSAARKHPVTDLPEGPPSADIDLPSITLQIDGTRGHDEIEGSLFDEFIFGRSGNDTIDAGGGNDIIFGGKGRDYINGGLGDDYINGGQGNDWINGDDGHDAIYGGQGNDWINGGTGNDVLRGGLGRDYISGGTGNDLLKGAKGDDALTAGEGNDTLYGGRGADEFSFGSFSDTNVIADYESKDTIILVGGLVPVSMGGDNLEIIETFGSIVDGSATLTFADGTQIIFQGIDTWDDIVNSLTTHHYVTYPDFEF